MATKEKVAGGATTYLEEAVVSSRMRPHARFLGTNSLNGFNQNCVAMRTFAKSSSSQNWRREQRVNRPDGREESGSVRRLRQAAPRLSA
ncbi:hypothetical protein EYF80_015710 [Liparis tanakae]|uniref:Uncharacterized protein n=1 Tax=Liparis tanakae TaxID=230148 RepID=A0A4Z2I7Q0_9TELE|nr:hypothetical protein EYF80_015710 [Liparis tanakae]